MTKGSNRCRITVALLQEDLQQVPKWFAMEKSCQSWFESKEGME